MGSTCVGLIVNYSEKKVLYHLVNIVHEIVKITKLSDKWEWVEKNLC